MPFPARLILTLLFAVCLLALSLPNGLFAVVTPAFAQTSSVNADVPENLHTRSQAVLLEVMAAGICQLTGIDPINPKQSCLGVDNQTGKIGFAPTSNSSPQVGGLIGLTTGTIGTFFIPPAHTGDYIQYLSQNFGIAKPAYAQGVGFNSLKPLAKIWSAFANIVYIGFVVVFILVGLAIMLRIKIDPRTVMTIENQIPGIIISIILVTFSFAIAGFLIDLMWVTMYIALSTFAGISDLTPETIDSIKAVQTSFHATDAASTVNNLYGKGGLHEGGIATIIKDSAGGIKDMVTYALGGHPEPIESLFVGGGAAGGGLLGRVGAILFGASVTTGAGIMMIVVSTLVGMVIAIVMGGGFSGWNEGANLIGAGAGLIALFFIFFAVLFALFRIGWELLKAYIYILINIALAPFWIIAGLFPGSPIGVKEWFQELLANLSAFPTTLIMLLLGRVFVDMLRSSTDPIFVPPMIMGFGNSGAGATGTIGSLVGLGILFLTPTAINMMKDLIKTPQFKYSSAIGQATSFGGQTITGGITKAHGTRLAAEYAGSWHGGLHYLLTGQLPFYNPSRKTGKTTDSGGGSSGLPSGEG